MTTRYPSNERTEKQKKKEKRKKRKGSLSPTVDLYGLASGQASGNHSTAPPPLPLPTPPPQK